VGDIRRALLPDAGVFEKVEALPHHRLAAGYENLRKAAISFEKDHGTPPKLFLVTLGPLRKHKIRADFTRGFFGSGGFEIIYPQGFEDAQAAADAFSESGARVGIVCGGDDQYEELFPAFAEAIKEKMPESTVVLAGHPGENEERYRKAGMDDYIWARSDNFTTNRDMLGKAGVSLPNSTR
jgi:methylmalonyl-CoA mutase